LKIKIVSGRLASPTPAFSGVFGYASGECCGMLCEIGRRDKNGAP
jgi:hypothetical protein